MPAYVGRVRPGKAGLGNLGNRAGRKPRRPRPRIGTVGKPRVTGLGNSMPQGPKPNLGAAAGPKPNVAPKAVAPPKGNASPDAAYYKEVDTAERAEQARLGELEGQEQGIKHEFGIDDPTNPFSRAEGLKRSYLARQKAASASLASRGQLYSGSHERALARTRREEEQARAELRSAYESALGSISSARTNVQFQTEEQQNQAFEDWLARAPEAEVESVLDNAGAAPAQPKPAGTPPVVVGSRPQGAAAGSPPVVVGSRPQQSSGTVRNVSEGLGGLVQGKTPPVSKQQAKINQKREALRAERRARGKANRRENKAKARAKAKAKVRAKGNR